MKTLIVQLDTSTIKKLAEEAARQDITLEQLAEATLSSSAQYPDGMHEPIRAWVEDVNTSAHMPPGEAAEFRTEPEDYEGPYVELDQALDTFSAELTRRLKSAAG